MTVPKANPFDPIVRAHHGKPAQGVYNEPMPNATEGRCKKCRKFGELGDGYCIKCWDRTAGKNRKSMRKDQD